MASFSKQKYGENRLCVLAYDSTGAQEVIDVPYLQNGCTVQLSPVGGGAYVQASNDGINWETWSAGTVEATRIAYVPPVRFLRVTVVDATTCAIAVWGF